MITGDTPRAGEADRRAAGYHADGHAPGYAHFGPAVPVSRGCELRNSELGTSSE